MEEAHHAYEVVVIGAGPGGATAAKAAALAGHRVALVSQRWLMGYGLEGAFKSKAMWEIAREYHIVRSRWKLPSFDPLDLEQVAATTAQGAEQLREMHRRQFEAMGVDLYEGRGTFVDAHHVAVGMQRLEAEHVIIATGTHPRTLRGVVPDGRTIVTSDEIVAVDKTPKSLLVLGAGVIGCEFASIFAALGVDVTLLDTRERILSHEDEDVSALLTRSFERLGVRVLPSVRCESIDRLEPGVLTCLRDGTELLTEMALLAIGRVPNTQGLNLAAAGVETDARGYVPVSEDMQTNVPHIYAVGDVGLRDSDLDLCLVHVAEAEARRAVAHLSGASERLETGHVPFIVFTLPTVAGAGENETTARRKYGDVRVGKFANCRNHRATARGSRSGFVKLIVGPPGDDRVLGARAIGDGVDTIVGETSLLIQNQMPYTDLLHAIHAHPSLDESLHGAAQIIANGALPYQPGEEAAEDLWISV